ncbi:MAG: AraC family transcriptional regulator [Limnochordia bacterium]|nr:AraC family transcriptional regulator [Limnochordia bacterium]MDD4517109.1 AraC family transcriptional regulator [Limnochordia bacterium]
MAIDNGSTKEIYQHIPFWIRSIEKPAIIKEIASSLGYGSIQAFSQAFSREVGISLSEYTKRVLQKT